VALIETQSLGRSERSLVTILTELTESKHDIVPLVDMFRKFFLLYAAINIGKFLCLR